MKIMKTQVPVLMNNFITTYPGFAGPPRAALMLGMGAAAKTAS